METEGTNYVPDETGGEFKEDTGNSCEKKDSDSKQCQSCPKSAVPFHSHSEYNKHLKEINTVFPGTSYPDKYPVGPYDEEVKYFFIYDNSSHHQVHSPFKNFRSFSTNFMNLYVLYM